MPPMMLLFMSHTLVTITHSRENDVPAVWFLEAICLILQMTVDGRPCDMRCGRAIWKWPPSCVRYISSLTHTARDGVGRTPSPLHPCGHKLILRRCTCLFSQLLYLCSDHSLFISLSLYIWHWLFTRLHTLSLINTLINTLHHACCYDEIKGTQDLKIYLMLILRFSLYIWGIGFRDSCAGLRSERMWICRARTMEKRATRCFMWRARRVWRRLLCSWCLTELMWMQGGPHPSIHSSIHSPIHPCNPFIHRSAMGDPFWTMHSGWSSPSICLLVYPYYQSQEMQTKDPPRHSKKRGRLI